MAWDDKAPTEEEKKSVLEAAPTPEELQAIQNYINKPEPSLGEHALAGLESIGRGATLNFADELAGVTGAVGEQLARGLGDSDIPSPQGNDALERMSGLYKEYRDTARRQAEQQKETMPVTTFTGELAGGFMLPGGVATKGISQLSKAEKMLKLAKTGAAGGAAIGLGTTEKELPQLAGEPGVFAQEVGIPAVGGALTTTVGLPVASKMIQAGASTGRYIKNIPIIKGSLEAFRRAKAGEKIVGTEALKEIEKEIARFAEEIFPKLKETERTAGQIQARILKEAEDQGVRLPPESVEKFVNENIEALQNVQSSRPEAIREAAQLQEMLEQAKSGKEVRRIKQEALPLKENPIEQQEYVLRQKLVREKGINPEDVYSEFVPTDDPNVVVGRVVQKMSGKDPVNEMEQLLSIQRSKLQRTENLRPEDIRYEFVPTDDPNKTVGRIVHKTRDAEGNLTGEKITQQKLFDKSDLSPKVKVLSQKPFNVQDLGPQFKEITEKVREGGKDLTLPTQFDVLRRDIASRAKFGEKPASTQEVLGVASTGTTEAKKILEQNIPEFAEALKGTASAKSALESLGLENVLTAEEARNKIIPFIQKLEDTGGNSSVIRARIDDLSKHLQQVNPELAQEIQPMMQNLASKYEIASETSKPGFAKLTGLTARGAAYTASATAGAVTRGAIVSPLKALGEMVPEQLQGLASRMAASGSKNAVNLAKTLEKAASEDLRGRNALFFALMQNPSYRELLRQYSPEMFKQEEK